MKKPYKMPQFETVRLHTPEIMDRNLATISGGIPEGEGPVLSMTDELDEPDD